MSAEQGSSILSNSAPSTENSALVSLQRFGPADEMLRFLGDRHPADPAVVPRYLFEQPRAIVGSAITSSYSRIPA